jgi:hypothetical protein
LFGVPTKQGTITQESQSDSIFVALKFGGDSKLGAAEAFLYDIFISF